jgi:hypothetical protein
MPRDPDQKAFAPAKAENKGWPILIHFQLTDSSITIRTEFEGRDIHMHAQGSTMHLNITHKLHVCVQQPEVDLVHAPCHQTATLRYDN